MFYLGATFSKMKRPFEGGRPSFFVFLFGEENMENMQPQLIFGDDTVFYNENAIGRRAVSFAFFFLCFFWGQHFL